MYPVSLTGRLVTLREFERSDAASALEIVGSDQVTQWLSFDTRDEAQTVDMIDGVVRRARLEPRTEYYLAVTLNNGDLIGFARLGFSGVKAAKLGYAIRPNQWRHGYATDAARALVDFGFRALGLHRISSAIGPDNAASVAVVHRLGMQYEGRIRDHVYTGGTWRDSLLYSVLADE